MKDDEDGKLDLEAESRRPVIEVRPVKKDRRTPLEKLRGSVIEVVDPFTPAGGDDWDALS